MTEIHYSHDPDFQKHTDIGQGDWVEHEPFSKVITGAKGGGESDPPDIADDTHKSNTIARVLLVYSVGETEGLLGNTAAERAANIYFNKTPLYTPDSGYNFKGVRWWERKGTEDQTAVEGFERATNVVTVGTQLTKDGGAITRTVTTADVASVRVIIGFPSLVKTDNDDGDQKATDVSLKFEVFNDHLGVWENRGTKKLTGKASNGFEIAYAVKGPTNRTVPWLVRVTRITDDSDSQYLLNNTFVQRIIEVSESQETYPGISYFALEIDVELFGDNVPTCALKVSGVKVRVPNNYYETKDDATGVSGAPSSESAYPWYNGAWNGTFKWSSTSNPAWHLYHLAIQQNYGAGIPAAYMDKYALYSIAQYCDAINPSTGQFVGVNIPGGGKRRRFTINTQMLEAEDALTMLQNIASAFRGLIYYGAGAIVSSQDSPKTVSAILTNENVLDGIFTYATSEAKNRITIARVTYNDRDNFFEPTYVQYPDEDDEEDDPNVLRYGRNVAEVVKFGCDNEAEAEAYARWIVHSSLNEARTVTFSAGPEHAALRPGDLIEVYDRRFAKERFGGRIKGGSTATKVVLDAPVTLKSGQTYQITIKGNDGKTIYTRNITSGAGTRSEVNCVSFGFTPTANYTWAIKGTDIDPQKFRVIVVSKQSLLEYEVFAMQYDDQKYAVVEQGKTPKPKDYIREELTQVNAVTNIVFKRRGVNDPATGQRNDLVVGWTASTSPNVRRYTFRWRQRGEPWSSPVTVNSNITSFTIKDVRKAWYDVLIVAENVKGVKSLTAEASYEVTYTGSGTADLPSLYPPTLLDPV